MWKEYMEMVLTALILSLLREDSKYMLQFSKNAFKHFTVFW